MHAHVTAEGRGRIRRIKIGGRRLISDSGPDLADDDLGPTSPEPQAGVLGSLRHLLRNPQPVGGAVARIR